MPIAALVLRTSDSSINTWASSLLLDAPVAAVVCSPDVGSPAQRTPPPAATRSSSSSFHLQFKSHAASAPRLMSQRGSQRRAPVKTSAWTSPQSARSSFLSSPAATTPPSPSSSSSCSRRAAIASRPRPSPARRGSDWFPSPRRSASGRHQAAHHGGLHHSRGIYSSSSDSLSLCGEQRRQLLQRMQEHEGRLRRIHRDMRDKDTPAATAAVSSSRSSSSDEREESREGGGAAVMPGSDGSRGDVTTEKREGQHDQLTGSADSPTARVRTARRALFPESGGGSQQGESREAEVRVRTVEEEKGRVDAAAASSEQDAAYQRSGDDTQAVNGDELSAAHDEAQQTHHQWT